MQISVVRQGDCDPDRLPKHAWKTHDLLHVHTTMASVLIKPAAAWLSTISGGIGGWNCAVMMDLRLQTMGKPADRPTADLLRDRCAWPEGPRVRQDSIPHRASPSPAPPDDCACGVA